MGRSCYQVYKVVTPTKNSETGEICEDVISVKCNSFVNEETGELEEKQKDLFKVPNQNKSLLKKNDNVKLKCEMCTRGRHSLILLLVTLSVFLPSVVIFFYLVTETLLHSYLHDEKIRHSQRAVNFRNKLHCLFYSQFCAFCQSERSMDRVGKLQDERLAKMRKYVKNIPIQ